MRKFALALLLIAASPAPAAPAAAAGNATLGLHVPLPAGWHVVTAEANARNLRAVEMKDKEFHSLLVRYANVPIVAYSKYKEPYRDLNPSFKVNVRPVGSFGGYSARNILSAGLPIMKRGFPDLTILQGPMDTTVSGHRAAYAKIGYTLRANGRSVPAISELWVVPRGSHFFLIGAGTRRDEANGTRAEIRTILNSMRIR